jgi:hypothetical protein
MSTLMLTMIMLTGMVVWPGDGSGTYFWTNINWCCTHEIGHTVCEKTTNLADTKW